MWPFRGKKHNLESERAAIVARHSELDQTLANVQRQRSQVESIRDFLVTRNLKNGFGEDLTIAWTPRGR